VGYYCFVTVAGSGAGAVDDDSGTTIDADGDEGADESVAAPVLVLGSEKAEDGGESNFGDDVSDSEDVSGFEKRLLRVTGIGNEVPSAASVLVWWRLAFQTLAPVSSPLPPPALASSSPTPIVHCSLAVSVERPVDQAAVVVDHHLTGVPSSSIAASCHGTSDRLASLRRTR
jgi:hypothetical protein